jgi:uncharacterized protein involved in exopolysaccharide biosynthesis
MKKAIAKTEALKRQTDAELAKKAKEGQSTALVTDQPNLIEIESRLKAIRLEINNDKRDIEKLHKRILESQGHLSLTPVREQQLSGVTRDYENARQSYQSLLQKKDQSELATNLEKRQQGEQFRIIDPPSLPEKPVQPNRPEIMLAGWLLGLVGGVGLTALREATDARLHGEEDVVSSTKVPVLVSIPVLRTPWGEARKNRQRGLEAAGVAVLVLVAVASAVYTYLVG